MADIFISYASEDRERVLPLVGMLEEQGFSVWWDTHLDMGSRFDREIERELDDASCVLVVWSRTSINSDWVRDEASEGLQRNILVPVRIDDCRPPLGFRRVHTAFLKNTSSHAVLTDRINNLVRTRDSTSISTPPPPRRRSRHGEVGVSIQSSGSVDGSNIALRIREEISGLLSKIGWLHVIPAEVQLTPNYQLDVRLDPVDAAIRLSCRLVDDRTEAEISAFSRVYESLSEFVANTSRVSAGIVGVLLEELYTAERRRSELVPNDDATCWELCNKGRNDLDTRVGVQRAFEFLLMSVEQDPAHAYTHARLSFVFAYLANTGDPNKRDSRRDRARQHLESALSLDDKDPLVMHICVMSMVHLGEIDRASDLGDALYTYFPVWGWSPIAMVLAERKDYADALELLEEHRTYHPQPGLMKSREAIIILLLNGEYDEALRVASRLATFENSSYVNWVLYANVLGFMDRRNKAVEAWVRATEMVQGLSVERWRQGWSTQFQNSEVPKVLTEGLQKAGIR